MRATTLVTPAALRILCVTLASQRAGIPRCRVDADEPLLNLLAQRAVQTCCFTARNLRDGPTATWLDDFAGGGVEDFHGIDGLSQSWQWHEFYAAMLAAPHEEIEVESTLMKHRGGSPNNPYLQPTPMTYAHTIVPATLAERVMSAGSTIAAEWIRDLKAYMEAENEERWRNRRREIGVGDPRDSAAENMPANEAALFSDDEDSPYRGGNYDLLKTLLTREAVRATLADDALADGDSAFLRDFATERPLGGEQPYHRADVFIDEMLDAPVAIGAGATPAALVDPSRVVARVLDERRRLADAWAETLERVPDEHVRLKREWLATLETSDG